MSDRSSIKKERELKVKRERLKSKLKKNHIFSEFYLIEPKVDFSLGRPSPCLYNCEKDYLLGRSGGWCQDCAIRL